MPESTILVVDNEPRVVELIRTGLELEGLRIVACVDGSAAVELARRERPALILLDLASPGIDGWAVLDRLEQDSRTAGIPVVMLTDRADDPYILRGLEKGAIEFLLKPLDRARLVELVWHLLEDVDSRGREEHRRQLMAERRRLRRSLDELF